MVSGEPACAADVMLIALQWTRDWPHNTRRKATLHRIINHPAQPMCAAFQHFPGCLWRMNSDDRVRPLVITECEIVTRAVFPIAVIPPRYYAPVQV